MQAQCVRNIQQQSLRGHRVDEIALRSGPVGSLAPGPGSDHDVMSLPELPTQASTKEIASTWDCESRVTWAYAGMLAREYLKKCS